MICIVPSSATRRYEADRAKIPPGFVPYSDAELLKLFAPEHEDISINTLQMIHAAKKMGRTSRTYVPSRIMEPRNESGLKDARSDKLQRTSLPAT